MGYHRRPANKTLFFSKRASDTGLAIPRDAAHGGGVEHEYITGIYGSPTADNYSINSAVSGLDPTLPLKTLPLDQNI